MISGARTTRMNDGAGCARTLRKDTAYNACAPPFDGSWQILASHTVTATHVLKGFARREPASVIACTLDGTRINRQPLFLALVRH